MARKPMVTRKINITTVNVLCLNVETAEPFNRVVKLTGRYNNELKLRKVVDKKINNDTEKTVHIVDVTQETKLLGMTEEEFMSYAKPLTDDRKIVDETK